MTLKKTLMAGAAGAALFAIASPVATTADAGSLKSGNSNADVKIYGQVGRGILFYSDGEQSDWISADADNSSSRFGFNASAKITDSVTISAVLEQEMESNSPNSINQASDADVGGSFTQRKAELSFKSKSFGRFTMGQTSVISDGMSDGLDLGGASIAFAGMDPSLSAGGLSFRNDNTAAKLSTKTVRGSFGTLDGGRADAIQYETPSMGGVRVQLGISSAGKEPGIGLLYDGKHGSMKVRVRGFWENANGSGTDQDRWQLGASVKHDSGISLTALYGNEDQRVNANGTNVDQYRDDWHVYAVRLGYTANMNSLGPTAVGLDYRYSEGKAADGDEGTAFGFGVSQNIKKAGADLFANMMVWELERQAPSAELDKLVTVFVGGRLKF